MAETYLALLRAINVGRNNKILMSDLTNVFVRVGCNNVQTYIQSGNVIFEAAPELSQRLPDLVRTEIERRFGLQVPTILRALREMREVVNRNPFLEEGGETDVLHVLFLADRPKAAAVVSLDPDRSPPNRFVVHGKEVYLFFPIGFARNKLSGAYFDSKLETAGTMRNWRTVTKLLELMEQASAGSQAGPA
jgi:uncharacterized protein (DUF1697 family)